MKLIDRKPRRFRQNPIEYFVQWSFSQVRNEFKWYEAGQNYKRVVTYMCCYAEDGVVKKTSTSPKNNIRV